MRGLCRVPGGAITQQEHLKTELKRSKAGGRRAVQGEAELREALGNERESCRRAGAAAASAAHDRRLLTEAVQLQIETQDARQEPQKAEPARAEVKASTSFTRHKPASRSDSFRSDAETSSLSIVFSADWVQVGAPIGEGAFSRVYEGLYTNPDSGEQSVVAVKILKKSMLKRRSDCLRFIKEAKIQTRTLHRNIVACYGIGKYEDDDPHHPGSLFIVQELVQGGNMLHKVYKQMMNRQKCVYNSEEAMAWLLDVASGMEYLHMSHEAKPMIIHRDLKLENIMLAPDPSLAP
ncbi:MAG: hypothetical protein WDW38_008218 [Sanguina aurantia]